MQVSSSSEEDDVSGWDWANLTAQSFNLLSSTQIAPCKLWTTDMQVREVDHKEH